MSDADAAEFLSSYGLTESGLVRLIRTTYALLGLISFFTVGEDECRAWTIPVNTRARSGCGRDPFRSGEAFHSRRNHPLGSVAGGWIGGQCPRQRNSAPGGKRLHRAGRRRDAHPSQRIESIKPRTEELILSLSMHPILLSLMLGLTAAPPTSSAAPSSSTGTGTGLISRYFIALGAGFMLATAIVEMFPASIELEGKKCRLPRSARLSDHPFLRARGHPALSLRRGNSHTNSFMPTRAIRC